MKRLITFSVLIAILATSALAHDFEVDGIYYVINTDGTSVSVSYKGTSYDEYSDEYSGHVTIPPTVTYSSTPYSVTKIFNAFRGCGGLTSVTIPNSVTSIGSYSFYNCSSLTSVTIPDSVTSIGNSTFYGCSNLTSVTIPNSVTSIGSYSFYNCSSLTSVTIPNSVTSIGSYSFYGCSSLTSVTIPDSVTSIGEEAFNGCSGLSKVEISDLATWCGISFGSGISNPLYCAHHLYLNGNEIKYLDIPDSVTSIGNYAFMGCSGLTSVTIPNSVTSIGDYAFHGCGGLKSVTIGNSVASIGTWVFKGCGGLKTVNWNAKDCSITTSYEPFKELTGITTFNFGNEVQIIPACLCSGLSRLKSVSIPNSVTSIGERAFDGCSGLIKVEISDLAAWCGISFGSFNSSNPLYYAHHLYLNGNEIKYLDIPDSVTSIGSYSFYGCSSLTSVTIPDSVTSIGEEAFNGCSGLTSVTIPNSVTSIGYYAFYECGGLTKVEISDLEAWCKISFGGFYANPLSYAKHLYLNGSEINDLVIPNSVTSIGNRAFEGCSGLTSVTIPNSVTSIGGYAFEGCSGLTSVTIPNSVTSIGYYAFYNCI